MIDNYIQSINKRFKTGISTEHSYRSDLQILLEALSDDVLVTNEPTRIDCGAPDYIITKHSIPVGYIEAKDIGVSLKKTDKTEQLKRYKAGLNNLILTDYLDFRLYRNGKFVTSVAVADISGGELTPLPQNYQDFENLIQDFYTHIGQSIKSAQNLAEMMAGKARMMQAVIDKALSSDAKNYPNSSLKDQMTAFKRILIHDITPSEFADIYAQTVAYGMFAARLHDKTPENFSRQDAAELIPKTNPFLRRFFGYIAGPEIDDRIKWIVDALADIFRAADLAVIMENFGGATHKNDPVIHFYETFLAEYNPKLRKSRGVWYTPEPVVNFIVRAVDDILKTEFGLAQGLADTSKVRKKVNVQGVTGKVEKDFHKVQILDPATGTGTFLAEVIKQIYEKFKGQEGIWSGYVENELIPRLNGFEILMASYAMTHLKLDLLLRETGYKPKNENRFRVFLTNSLEKPHPNKDSLFATYLTYEATEANLIKQDTPVMVVLGNPPYSGHSANKGKSIDKLLKDYKQEPGGGKLKEKNSKWLNDDYVKFIRYGQNFIEKNGEGILAFINNHSFLDNPTFRGMRWHLLKTFDKIYIIDLHGNAKKKEVCPDGSPDKNVFDIQQGVSINLFVKTGKKKKSGEVFHYDLYGDRESKYEFLWKHNIENIKFKKLQLPAPQYFFVQKDYALQKKYDKGFSVNDLFLITGVGMTTAHDEFVIDNDSDMLLQKFVRFKNSSPNAEQLHSNFNVKKKKGWNILDGWNNLQPEVDLSKFIKPIAYRPFDNKFIFYENKLVWRIVYKVMQHFIKGDNIGLAIGRQGQVVGSMSWNLIYISKFITDFNLYYRGGGMIYPLYIYPETKGQQTFDNDTERKPNLNDEIVQKIEKSVKLKFTPEKEETQNTFAPIDILDYIYAVLHSPSYRKKYKEFLKIDFPRVPYPKTKTVFGKLVELGGELRTIHLLENPVVEQYITTYPEDGDNMVTRRILKKDYEITDTVNQTGRVWINAKQYFGNVPHAAWEFYIGGYQPAKKWLKDRHGRELGFEDILHYQKIIVALTETEKIMKRIDEIHFL
ncbi:N-6 DNA methylase [Desulfococcaceae bacterium HSG7]|nr:N-6 DNA methylase [Desulfococcaceae bacterium HSG7]